MSQIAVLGLHKSHTEKIKNIMFNNQKLSEYEDLTIDSCLRYKGLEKNAVIVLLPDWKIMDKDRFLSQVYTGITRPKSILKLLIGKENIELLSKYSSTI